MHHWGLGILIISVFTTQLRQAAQENTTKLGTGDLCVYGNLNSHWVCGRGLVIHVCDKSFLSDKIKRIIIPNLTRILWGSDDIRMQIHFVNWKVLQKRKGWLWPVHLPSPTFTQARTDRPHSWKYVWHVGSKGPWSAYVLGFFPLVWDKWEHFGCLEIDPRKWKGKCTIWT